MLGGTPDGWVFDLMLDEILICTALLCYFEMGQIFDTISQLLANKQFLSEPEMGGEKEHFQKHFLASFFYILKPHSIFMK